VRDGVHEAESWLRRVPDLPPDVPPSLRARFWMARARVLCYRGNHAEEMECAVPGRAAAELSGDPVLRVRAMALTAHITPEHGLAGLDTTFAAAEAAGIGAEVAHLRPLLTIERRAHALERGDVDAAIRLDEELARDATALGNRRLLGFVTANRANRHYQKREREAAIAIYRELVVLFRQLGDRRALFGVSNMLAWAALHRDDLEDAARQIEDNRELVEGLGYAGEEKELLRSRFELAMRRRDVDLAAELKRQIERFDNEATAEEQRCLELRAKLRAVEADREASARAAAVAQARVEAVTRDAITFGSLGIAAALAALVVMSWRARRSLLVANRRLAEQVSRVEESQAAQAKLEERMRQIERTERLGTMAAGVAHDFNNLLTGILGNAELIAQSPGDAVNAERAHVVRAAGMQAARLCRQLQVYAGDPQAPLETIDLVLVAREMLPGLRAAAGACVVDLYPAVASLGVPADRAQVEQVLLNLVVNAVDAGAGKVDITLDVATTVGAADEARIVVADDGDGMSTEVQARIFDPFFTTRFPGRGLGLAVVHGAVRRHGGRIDVQSVPGAGTTFTIMLPGAGLAEPVVTLPRPVPVVYEAGPVTALVVDDDASIRSLLLHVLRRHGHEVVVVGRSEELAPALSSVAGAAHVVAFVDLTMPGMDGLEVAQALRARRADAAVVLMSGHPPEYVEQVAGSVRADHVLAKPFAIDDIPSLVRSLAAAPRVAAAGSVA